MTRTQFTNTSRGNDARQDHGTFTVADLDRPFGDGRCPTHNERCYAGWISYRTSDNYLRATRCECRRVELAPHHR